MTEIRKAESVIEDIFMADLDEGEAILRADRLSLLEEMARPVTPEEWRDACLPFQGQGLVDCLKVHDGVLQSRLAKMKEKIGG